MFRREFTLCALIAPILISGLSLDNKYFLVSRTILSILTDFINAGVYMVLALPLISTSLILRVLGTVPRDEATIIITSSFMFYNFFSFLAK